MWAIDQVVVACLAVIGLFTTTFSIIEPRPLLAISHQAHVVIDPIWSSFQQLSTPLGLSGHGDIPLYDNDTAVLPYTAALHHTVAVPQTDASPHSVAVPHTVPVHHTLDNLSAVIPLPDKARSTSIFSMEQPIDQQQIVVQCLIGLCFAVLFIVLFRPIKGPTNQPGKSRVKTTRRAVQGSCGNQRSILDTITDSVSNTMTLCTTVDTSAESLQSCMGSTLVQDSTSDEQRYESLSILDIALCLENKNLQQELRAATTSKEDIQAEIKPLREQNANLQKELEVVMSSKEHVQAETEPLKEQNANLHKELEAAMASKESVQAEIEPLKEQNTNLQKEVANSKEVNARMQARSSDNGRKMKALECRIDVKNKDFEDLAVKVTELSDNLSAQGQLLKTKNAEYIELERKSIALSHSFRALKQEFEDTKVQLSKKVEVLKSTEQSFAKLKQQETTAKTELITALRHTTVLKASLAAESEKVCKWEGIVQAEQKKKLDIEKQLNYSRKQKADLESYALVASQGHAEIKKLLSIAHDKERQMVYEISCKDNAFMQISGDFTRYQAAHQIQVGEWTATRGRLLLQADNSLRLQKAAQAEALEAQHALLHLQAARASAFTTIAMIAKNRSGSGESASTNTSESSATTSPSTNSEGNRSGTKPVLDALAIAFRPQTSSSPLAGLGRSATNNKPVHEHCVRKGRLARQLRRTSKASRMAEPKIQTVRHVSLKLSSIRLHLPIGRYFVTAISMLDVTIRRVNDCALVAFHTSPDTSQSSSVQFLCDMSHFRTGYCARYVLFYFRQTAKMLVSDARIASIPISAAPKAVSSTIRQPQKISTSLRSKTPAKDQLMSSKWASDAPVRANVVTAPKEQHAAPETKTTGQLIYSQWALEPPVRPIIVPALKEQREAPEAEPKGQTMSSKWASATPVGPTIELRKEQRPTPKAKPAGQLMSSKWGPVDIIRPNIVTAPEEHRLTPEVQPRGQPISSRSAPVVPKDLVGRVIAVAPAEPTMVHGTGTVNQVTLSRWAPDARKGLAGPVSSMAPAEPTILQGSKPVNQVALSRWAQVTTNDPIDPVNVVASEERVPAPKALPVNDMANSRWALAAPKPSKVANIPCRYFSKGQCKKGKSCPYKH